MKFTRFFSLILFLFCSLSIMGTDIVRIKQKQVPVMLERSDNPTHLIRINAKESKKLDQIRLSLGDTDLKNIKAIRLYFGGTESPQFGDTLIRYAPVQYLSRNDTRYVRDANLSYSVKVTEEIVSEKEIVLKANRELRKGINYFWLSVELKPDVSLTSTMGLSIDEILVDNKKAELIKEDSEDYRFRPASGVRYAGDDDVTAYRIPGLVTSKEGTLIGVYDIRYNRSNDLQEKIDIGVSRSTDKGQTWEPMQVAMTFGEYGGLPHAQNGVGDPAILVDDVTGTIWIIAAWTHGMGNHAAWFNSMPGMTPEETAQLVLVKSEDDGKTWSEPINITSQVKDPSWYFLLQGPGMGITMQDGTLVFPIQFIDSERIPNAGVMYSKDRGNTWHIHNLARTNTTEAQVAEVEPGVLMLNMRDNRGGSRAVSVTKDLGKTWTEHPSNRSALREPVCMASLIKINAKDNVLGKDILLFSNPDTTKGRNHITIKASLDGGLTWPEKYQIMLDEEEGWGYSCLTQIDRETVGILYEGSTAHMIFQAVKLTDLIQ